MRLFLLSSVLPVFLLSACASVAAPDPVPAAEPQVQTPVVQAPVTQSAPAVQRPTFEAYRDGLARRAIARGHDAALVARTIGAAEYYERTLKRDANQPEFTKPVWDYIRGAASADRIDRGRAEMAEHADTLAAVERAYGVPAHILAGIWGLETSYGRIMGDFDLFTTLTTLGYDGRRRDWAEEQVFAALELIRSGDVRPEQLRGAWAGAMGMTQFIPTTFRDYAVDFDGDGNKDLWGNEGDALASAANYLTRSGWTPGVPVAGEVVLPDGFDYSVSEVETMSVADWARLGVRPANGADWTPGDARLQARLLAPAGYRGPKLLAFDNFDVLMRYNPASAYVMGIASLGEALRGGQLVTAGWPEGDMGLNKPQKEALQQALTAQGYDTKGVDGLIGPATRAAIRAWQRDNGLPADGYVEQTLYRRIVG
ncbi:lytic murein transglycosylase [uncultured Algimonas sp.]|uniref:lytic murein transglycosylase n=1 Tax=uncultured Algimonas sp. TaxID=1547920 RepID=UPI00262988FC|nr:lytic murein transglycosylase [uncultured Algimonas sp.]